jgi:glycosyltransferase involved in cell wall biosynthesis
MEMSVTVLTKNCQETLVKTLQSLQVFPEVIILDTGSIDQTLELAKAFPNVKISKTPFTGFGPLHNLASSLATYPWILSIDSDETLSSTLISQLQTLKLDDTTVYAICRENFLNGKKIRCAGWHSDIVIRLYNRTTTRFSDDAVHERVLTQNLRTTLLNGTLHHTPYRHIGDFLTKMQTYTTLFAKERQGKEHSSFAKALFHGTFAFLKSYLIKRGIFGGKEGLIISLYNGQTAYYKYLKLAELNKTL